MVMDISVGSHVAGAPVASGGTEVIGEVAKYGHCQRSTSIGRIESSGNKIRADGGEIVDGGRCEEAVESDSHGAVKSKLREIQKTNISFAEFVEIYVDSCSNRDQGQELAKTLDDSGAVIVLGNVVFLKPDQVVKAIQGLMPVPVAHPNDPRIKELEEMEKQKAAIDKKAESLVFRELWGGLGYLVVQTAVFMRLTFWELTWDVMEPICFYVTSLYFMAGYAFFLRTSKEPSFEGFYQSRFSAKQKRLMQIHNFDLGRYNELRRACYPYSSSSSSSSSELALSPFNSERTEFGGAS